MWDYAVVALRCPFILGDQVPLSYPDVSDACLMSQEGQQWCKCMKAVRKMLLLFSMPGRQ